MTREEVLKILEDLTEKFEKTEFCFCGIDWWPLIKLIAGSAMHSLINTRIEEISYPENKSLTLENRKISLRNILRFCKNRFFNSIEKKSEIAVFTFNSNISTQYKNEKINQFTKPFLNYFNSNEIKYDLFDIYEIPNILSIHFRIQSFRTVRKYNKCIKFQKKIKEVSDYLQDKVDEKFILYKSLAINIVHSQLYYLIYKYFFSKAKYKKILFYCYYDSSLLGIIRAANELNIETIEYQHSQISDKHYAYHGWTDRIKKILTFYPKKFWAWRNIDVQLIEKGFRFSPKFKAIRGGNVFVSLFENESKERNTNKKILITLQGKPLPQFIINCIINSDNIIWYIRYHPRYPQDKTFVEDLCKIKPENIEIEKSNTLSILELLEKVDYHITWFSGAAIEAEMLKVQNIIYGKEGYETYKEEIDGKIYFFVRNEKDLDNIIKNNLKSENLYISNLGKDKVSENIISVFKTI